MSTAELPTTPSPAEPDSFQEFLRRGWTFYIQRQQPAAEDEFRQALNLEPKNIEGLYALGLSLKVQHKYDLAIVAFTQVLELIQAGNLKTDPGRATMLRHLSQWHLETIHPNKETEPHP